MLNELRNRAQDEKGFTLIELLVVFTKNTDGTIARACTRPSTKGGCPSSLSW